MIEQCFQFLYALGFSLKDKVMFFVRQALKIDRAVIVFDTIKVMNYPAFRKWLPVCLLPNKYMFKNIRAGRRCTGMVRCINKNITIVCFVFTAFPTWMVWASSLINAHCMPSIFSGTGHTTCGSWVNLIATINTKMGYFARPSSSNTESCGASSKFHITCMATSSVAIVSTIYAFMFLSHMVILTPI